MADKPRLIVVDDDPELRELIGDYLAKQGYDVVAVADGAAMDEALRTRGADLVVLDLMLPGEDGLSIAKRLKRRDDLPVVMVSARGEDDDRINGLETGADDYLAKPFNPRELLARVRAVLRRAGSVRPTRAAFSFGDFKLDFSARRLTRGDEVVALTSGEFDLLAIFVRHPNEVLDRDRLLDLLKGTERSPVDRSIDVRIARLRGKIEPNPGSPTYIQTVWGRGYLFAPP